MSECPFCRAEVQQGASVCRGCGAEKVTGYVDKQLMKVLVGIGMVIALPVSFVIMFSTHSTPLMFLTIVLLMGGPVGLLKLKNKDKVSWIRPTAR